MRTPRPMKPTSMLAKDHRTPAPLFQHRHFAWLAAQLASDHGCLTPQRLADALGATNPRFDRARFLRACGVAL